MIIFQNLIFKALFLTAVYLMLLGGGVASAAGESYVLLYWGKYSEESFRNTPFKSWDLEDEELVALAVGKEVWRHRSRSLSLELEGQLVDHFGDEEHYLEVVAACNLRWHRFPWNQILGTTVAFGGGLSCTSRVPDQEEITHGNSAHLLCYLMYKFTVDIPRTKCWSLFFRVHHLSGIFGLRSGVDGASNYPSLGLKYMLSASR